MRIEEQLERFRKEYPSVRVMVYDDFLSYKVADGCANRAAQDANEVIEMYSLDGITAIPTPGYRKDSFIVRAK